MSRERRAATDPGGIRDEVVGRLAALVGRLSTRRGVRHVVMGAAGLDPSWRWSDAVGQATINGPAMTIDTPFLLASVTKLYIAAVVLKLWERGHLDVSAPISSYLPGELGRGLHVLDGVDHTARITPAHLLGHHTGLPDWLDDRPPGGGPALIEQLLDDDRFVSLEDAVVLCPRSPHAALPAVGPTDAQGTDPLQRHELPAAHAHRRAGDRPSHARRL